MHVITIYVLKDAKICELRQGPFETLETDEGCRVQDIYQGKGSLCTSTSTGTDPSHDSTTEPSQDDLTGSLSQDNATIIDLSRDDGSEATTACCYRRWCWCQSEPRQHDRAESKGLLRA